jgi:acyl-CoA reductase-like NAD-dependent aldehyde dehydrogenase
MASSDERPQPQLNSNGRVVPEFTKLFINNEWVDSVEGLTMDVINPATEEKICSVQRAGLRDVDRAVAAAREAFDNPSSAWRKMSQYERGRLLFRLADLIEQHADVIADLES